MFMPLSALKMIVCPVCGDKHCVHAKDHDAPCAKADIYAHNAWVDTHLTVDTVQAPIITDWISVQYGPCGIVGGPLPEEGQEVEVIRDYGRNVANPGHPAFGCRFGIEKTTTICNGRIFSCDISSTGHVTHWRPAMPAVTTYGDGYPSLTSLLSVL